MTVGSRDIAIYPEWGGRKRAFRSAPIAGTSIAILVRDDGPFLKALLLTTDVVARTIMASGESDVAPGESSPDREQELAQIREALRNLRFGAVNIVVQDGVVVQIDRTERRRLRQPSKK